MGIGDFFRRVFASAPLVINYSRETEARLRELWEERETLTEEALEVLRDEAAKRKLDLETPKPKPLPPAPKVEVPRAKKRKRKGGVHLPKEGMTFFPIEADGTQPIDVSGILLAFNQPVPDAPPGPRRTDPREISRVLLERIGHTPIGHSPQMLFVDSSWLLGDEFVAKEIGDRGRRSLFEAVQAAKRGDLKECLARLDGAVQNRFQKSIWADRLLARTGLDRLIEPCLTGAVEPNLRTVERTASADPGMALCLARSAGKELAPLLHRQALLSCLDSGGDASELIAAWDSLLAHQESYWRCGQVQVLARSDLSAALDLWKEQSSLETPDEDATVSLFRHVAAEDPNRALGLIDQDREKLGVDVMPALIGVALAGVEVDGVLTQRVEELGPAAYNPAVLFFQLVDLMVLRQDREGLVEVVERGGPSAWQLGEALRDPVARLFRDQPGAARELTDLATDLPTRPGVVAGRDASAGGLRVGKVVHRPDWLALDDPHPVDTVRLVLELQPDGPCWWSDVLP